MSNKTQKIQKAQKSFFTKVMLISFYFLMICYSQCGSAVIEKYLLPGTGDLYEFSSKGSRITIDSMELATEVATYLKNGRLCEVFIRLPEPGGDQDNIRQLILKALAGALRDNTALTTLDLYGNGIGNDRARALAEALQNNTRLTTLELGGNLISAEGVRALAETLRNNTVLTMLKLGVNLINDAGAQALAEALQNNMTLTALYLVLNQIGDEGASTLAEALRNNTALTTLDLGYNQIGDEGARAIAKALQNNTTLTTLYLWGNHLGDEGARVIAEALRDNTTLTTIDLRYNRIGTEGVRALATALTDNYTLLEFIDDGGANKKTLIRNNLLIELLCKIKRASSFTFAIGLHHMSLRYVSQIILSAAGLNVRNRTAFENVQDYNNEGIRDTVFKGSLEEVIRLFYYGSNADYGEILQEVNQIRRLQREILQEDHRVIPEGLVELPKYLPGGGFWTWMQGKREQQQRDFVTTTFWTS